MILTVVLFTPLVGSLVLLFVPRDSVTAHARHRQFLRLPRADCLAAADLALPAWTRPRRATSFPARPTTGFLLSGSHYSLGIARHQPSACHPDNAPRRHFNSIVLERDQDPDEGNITFLFLLLQVGMLGVFMSLDFFLFYMFWEVMLVPMYFLIGVWGSDTSLVRRDQIFLTTLVGSVIMLLGILALYFKAGGATFDMPTLLASAAQFDTKTQVLLFWAFFFAFAIKVPMFPFHTWLPDAHTEAPTAGSVILAGVLLKMGTYGFIRFSLPLLPQDAAARHKIVTIMLVVSIIGIIYGALVCMMQKDMKKLVAYSSVSHLAFCTLGIFALTPNGLSGSVIQQINHGLSTGALFLLIGVLYERRHTRLISEFGGLLHSPCPTSPRSI